MVNYIGDLSTISTRQDRFSITNYKLAETREVNAL